MEAGTRPAPSSLLPLQPHGSPWAEDMPFCPRRCRGDRHPRNRACRKRVHWPRCGGDSTGGCCHWFARAPGRKRSALRTWFEAFRRISSVLSSGA